MMMVISKIKRFVYSTDIATTFFQLDVDDYYTVVEILGIR